MRSFVVAVAAAALAMGAASVANAATYISTFQGATFTVTEVNSQKFTFQISGADALTGDWSTATHLSAFAFESASIGGGTNLSAVLTTPGAQGSSTVVGGLSGGPGGGCNGSGGHVCFEFSPNIAVAPNLSFDITTDGAFNFASTGPHLKIAWATSSTSNRPIGDLYSQNVPVGVVPEPTTWAMMLMGFFGAGSLLRSRRRTLALASA